MGYRCEAPTIEGFVQQLAVSYVANGYWFYVSGVIPEGKHPREVDAKLMSKYEVDVSKFVRARRKQAGLANVQYIRHRRFFVILATYGQHQFFLPASEGGEGESIRDLRREPIKFASYSITFAAGHASVRIERESFRYLKAYFVNHALRSSASLQQELYSLPFQPWAPVRRQLLSLLSAVNTRRKAAGYEVLPISCLRMRRRIVKPFGEIKERHPLQLFVPHRRCLPTQR